MLLIIHCVTEKTVLWILLVTVFSAGFFLEEKKSRKVVPISAV